jgi:hypothetical protein
MREIVSSRFHVKNFSHQLHLCKRMQKNLYRSCNKDENSFFCIQMMYFNSYFRVFPNLHTNAFLVEWPLYIA